MVIDNEQDELIASRPKTNHARAHFLANRDVYWDSVGRHLEVLRSWLRGEKRLDEPEVKVAVEGAVALIMGEWLMREERTTTAALAAEMIQADIEQEVARHKEQEPRREPLASPSGDASDPEAL